MSMDTSRRRCRSTMRLVQALALFAPILSDLEMPRKFAGPGRGLPPLALAVAIGRPGLDARTAAPTSGEPCLTT